MTYWIQLDPRFPPECLGLPVGHPAGRANRPVKEQVDDAPPMATVFASQCMWLDR
jgi:hypothetical protein